MLKIGRRFVVNARSLFTAFSLFRLRGDNLLYFQYVYPTLIMIVIFTVYHQWAKNYLVVDIDKVVASATTLMGVLVGFYIAALAAVTSFPNSNLDNIMAGKPTTLKERYSGKNEPISRRRFISILLGYCAFMSIMIFLGGSFSAAISISSAYKSPAFDWISCGYWVIYTWMISSLGIITLLCLHYLIDRMHRE
ncbi:hypothetical protein [Vreelandella titanicae]|uniref:hypothetical protein n=1 Tax=Vreelandella titanicae TaxID=664683 RepID=UPI001681970F|nr:hypothetical protein [Halomonas titanicae]QNU63670.1 hypothetical protein HZS52_04750 [Halomonas titanicae]